MGEVQLEAEVQWNLRGFAVTSGFRNAKLFPRF